MIRKKRRNPQIDDTCLRLLAQTLYDGTMRSLTNTLIYLKQGFYCKDCDEVYWKCKCDYCENCRSNKCICYLNLPNEYENAKKIIRKITLDFVNQLDSIERPTVKKILREIANNDRYYHTSQKLVEELMDQIK